MIEGGAGRRDWGLLAGTEDVYGMVNFHSPTSVDTRWVVVNDRVETLVMELRV